MDVNSDTMTSYVEILVCKLKEVCIFNLQDGKKTVITHIEL